MLSFPCPSSSRRHAAGAVAVEFALVMPLFLMILAMIIAFGQAMWARSQMLNFISSTARLCSQQLPVTQNSIRSCANQQMNAFSSQPMVGGCALGNLVVDISQDTIARDDLYQPNACIVKLSLTCKLAYIPFAGLLQGPAQSGMNIGVKASFPYLPNYNNGLTYGRGC